MAEQQHRLHRGIGAGVDGDQPAVFGMLGRGEHGEVGGIHASRLQARGQLLCGLRAAAIGDGCVRLYQLLVKAVEILLIGAQIAHHAGGRLRSGRSGGKARQSGGGDGGKQRIFHADSPRSVVAQS